MERKMQLAAVWCGAAFVLIFLVAFMFFTHWIPPISPALGAQEVADIFQRDSVAIRIGAILITLCAALYLPWTVVISDLMRQNETRSNLLSNTQLVGGVVAELAFFIPGFVWAAMAFRPDRPIEIIYAMNDFAWLMFVVAIWPLMIQYLAIAASIFADKRPEPTFPRWVAYLQIWLSISFLPALLSFFLKSGPFAWDGLFVWWLPLSLYTLWFIVMVKYCRRAVLAQ